MYLVNVTHKSRGISSFGLPQIPLRYADLLRPLKHNERDMYLSDEDNNEKELVIIRHL